MAQLPQIESPRITGFAFIFMVVLLGFLFIFYIFLHFSIFTNMLIALFLTIYIFISFLAIYLGIFKPDVYASKIILDEHQHHYQETSFSQENKKILISKEGSIQPQNIDLSKRGKI